jgi:hypothetical protein
LFYPGRLASASNDLIVLLHALYQIGKQFFVHRASYRFSLGFFKAFFSAAFKSSFDAFLVDRDQTNLRRCRSCSVARRCGIRLLRVAGPGGAW